MNATIINIGDELLIGQVVNTNASTMARLLTGIGMEVVSTMVVGDNRQDIWNAVDKAMHCSDAVLVTGGLGPTKDDITKHILCEYFGSELYENTEALDNVKRIFAARGYELTDVNRRQAWVPRCCQVLNNDLGTAPGMWFERDGHVLVSMAGVPFEMEWLMNNRVLPRLQQHFSMGAILNKNILIQGIGESFLSDLIEPWELALPSFIRLAYLPVAGMVKLRLTARGNDVVALQAAVTKAVAELYPLAGRYIVGEDCETLPELVAQKLTAMGRTLATAESCTGGTIASRLTALAGASAYFKGGIVAYSNEVKESVLGVRHETLAAYGAVSEETVREMVEGVRFRLDSDYAIATTGIAGPTGGTPDKPVGTVWVAVCSRMNTVTQLMHYGDRRQQTIDRTVNQAYAMLIRLLCQKD
jgi:nicotinamide-nucleotide amidase